MTDGQLAIVHRLGMVARSERPRCPVTIPAGELLALLNGFWQESRRADVAEARLQSLSAFHAADTVVSAN